MVFLMFILAVVILAVAALLWGADSRDTVDSCEWERRKLWPPLG